MNIHRKFAMSALSLGLLLTALAAPLMAKTHAAAHAKPVAKKTAAHAKAAAPRGKSVAAHANSAKAAHAKRGTKAVAASRRLAAALKGRPLTRRQLRAQARLHSRFGERFLASSFATDADNLTRGDIIAGEDPIVRGAAIQALGNMNGTALAIDPSSGRILAMVNQKLALSSGAEPCSTIKLTVALAALEEGIIKRDTPVSLGGGYRVDLTYALAKSINPYFETLGRTLGFERVKHYANEFGLGELAGYHIQGEQLGIYPDTELPAKLGGVGRMCSFGESISMTPLQLGAIVSAIANGGTLYYLQHPENAAQLLAFNPKVKRILDIAPIIPEIVPGMAGAVASSFGTARSLRSNFHEFPVMGKTGTCSNNGTRFGWFGSYAETPTGRIVTVIFLEGGRPTFGPKAAELTGQFYRALYDKSYFTPKVDAPVVSGTR